MKKAIQKVLVVNCGSSSLKFQLFDMKGETMLCKGLVERIGIAGSRLVYTKTGCDKVVREVAMKNHVEAIAQVMAVLCDPQCGVVKSLGEIDAIGHRVVHGGDKFSAPAKITAAAKALIRKCVPLAPLHNPANLQGIEACEKAAKGVPNVGVFDTAFHQTMPGCAYQYALPRKVAKKFGIRKYGFHGTSHKFITQAAAAWLKKPLKKVNLVTCHLGNGSSLAAVKNGECIDTTMGLTPLDGLIMGTRSGSLDPAILFFISKKYGYDIDRLDKLVNKESGLLGLSGLSNDMRTLTQAASEGHIGAQIALETFCYKLTREIGGIAMALPRIDALVFTGGIGENSRVVRKTVMENLALLGYQIDDARNEDNGKNSGHIISKDGTPTAMVVATNEELLIALDTEALVK